MFFNFSIIPPAYSLLALPFSFLLTFLGIVIFKKYLPKDQGRAFAVNGTLSEGKPRGCGIIITISFILSTLLFIPINKNTVLIMVILLLAMLSGFLDDAATKSWGEYKKALIDLLLCVVFVGLFIWFNGTRINLVLFNVSFSLPVPVYAILGVILIWTCINVTNCSDGVDGLCGSVSIVSLLTVFVLSLIRGSYIGNIALIFACCLAAYLWFNCSPSKLLMGDAGSRTIGFLFAICVMYLGDPFIVLLLIPVFIIDGGLGLVKVFLLRFLKIKILANTRTPIHDHLRKNKGWSDTQVVSRFIIIQSFVSILLLVLLFTMGALT